MTRATWQRASTALALFLLALAGRPASAAEPMATDGTLIYADRADPEGLDPTMFVGTASFIQGHLLFDTLLGRDNEGKLVPLLAVSWQVSPDGRRYTFKLRSDVEFHGGKKLTSADVRYSLERLGNPQVASPWRDIVKSVEKVEAPDPTTVVVHLARANRLFLDGMAHTGTSVVNRESVEKHGKDFGRTVVEGTGPFKLVERVANDRIVYERFDRYRWGPAFYQNRGPARVKRVVWRVIPELATRQLNMERGEVDLITHNTLPDILARAGELKGRVEITRRPVYETRGVALNANFNHLQDRAVRQAIAHAVNARGIAETIYAPVGVPAFSLLHFTAYGYSKGVEALTPKHDPARARQILDEAGWKLNAAGVREKNGLALKGLRLMGLPQYKDAALVIKEALADLGIGADIQLLERGRLYPLRRAGDVELEVLNTAGTPDVFMEMLHSSNFPGTNPFGWKDPRTDRLIETFLTEPDEAKALEASAQLQRIVVADEVVFVPLYWTSELTLVNSRTLRDFMSTHWLNSGVGKLLSVWSTRRP
jgi:peptide/nickel transport system substrate-binding protein